MCECVSCGEGFIGSFLDIDGRCPDCVDQIEARRLVVKVGSGKYAETPMATFVLGGRTLCTSFLSRAAAEALELVETVSVEIDG